MERSLLLESSQSLFLVVVIVCSTWFKSRSPKLRLIEYVSSPLSERPVLSVLKMPALDPALARRQLHRIGGCWCWLLNPSLKLVSGPLVSLSRQTYTTTRLEETHNSTDLTSGVP